MMQALFAIPSKFHRLTKRWSNSSTHGFTLIEVMVVLVISGILLAITYINVGGLVPNANFTSSIDSLVSDIGVQQNQAMMGVSPSNNPDDRGVKLDTDSYTLFYGDTFNPSDATNYTIELPPGIEIQSTTFSNGIIIFEQISGEVENFVEGQNTITIFNSATNQNTILTINRLGVVTAL